jgi:hypothetical protein
MKAAITMALLRIVSPSPPEAHDYRLPGAAGTIGRMSVFHERREELERYEFMMGAPRGRLAVTLDVITDALVLVGQHGVYCQSQRYPGKPVMDVQLISKRLSDAKDLISSVMEELRQQRETAGG